MKRIFKYKNFKDFWSRTVLSKSNPASMTVMSKDEIHRLASAVFRAARKKYKTCMRRRAHA